MTSQSWIFGMMVLAGIGIPVMAAMNAGLGMRIGPPGAAFILFLVGAGVAGAIAFSTGGLSLTSLKATPPWLFLGGTLTVFYILSVTFAAPRIGISAAIFCVLLGQIIAAGMIDHFGLFGAPRAPLNLTKLAGMALMVGGIMLARRPA